VANPHKEGRVRNVLLRNQPKLLEFMASFQSERADEQFVEEKEFLINEIANLQPAPSEPAAASREASSEGDEAGR
jgi:calcium binding protein 39|tara:strand:+ start:310 stop:534 length:225 start_codon:yes stop_codon:yes gene_type:complete